MPYEIDADGNEIWVDAPGEAGQNRYPSGAPEGVDPDTGFWLDDAGEPFDPRINETDPNDPRHAGFVQAGDTGGFLDDVGVTVGEGRSTRDTAAPHLVNEALAAGMTQEEVDSFLERNPLDFERLSSAFADDGERAPDVDRSGGGARLRQPGQPTSGPQGVSSSQQPNFWVFGDTGGGLQEVGADPFSQQIQGGLSELIGNQGLSGLDADMRETLRGLIGREGKLSGENDQLAQRIEAARQPLDALRKSQVDSLRGNLANRGLLSEPGQPQGSEISALGRTEEALAPFFATAGQNIGIELGRQDNDRLSQALNLATGLGSQQSQQFLDSLGAGTERQAILSQIALGTLDRNIEWNKFLAEFGLDRDRIMQELQQGNTEQVQSVLALFAQFLNAARGGAV